ncbi:hypothetical protein M9H77_21055 [Catharanthus roseus]|uniref:Uncharacterized protein n=1 Tax=Catharanthus roseus TaxID=4058 RepID=A0ACC0AMQ8_CATRO|nr:hypothetical protein M9H77_21055 [Catharanthus roseus]
MENKDAETETTIDRLVELGMPFLTKEEKSIGQKAIRKTFKGTAHLANLLPTGSVLAFRILSPVSTHKGNCYSLVSKYMTLGLLGFCSLSCFLLCFTDSIRDSRGKVRYGMATKTGLWIIDGSKVEISSEDSKKYKLKFIDFFHGFTSMLVFAAMALFDQNVVNCFYPTRTINALDFLNTIPVIIGVVCSLLFLVFPTTRHGIGFPLSKT